MTSISKSLTAIVLLLMVAIPLSTLIKPVNTILAIPSWEMTPNALPAGSSTAVVLSGNITGSAVGKLNYNCIGSNQTIDLWFDPTLSIIGSVCNVAADGAVSGYFFVSPSAAVKVYHGRLQGVPSDFTVLNPIPVTTQTTVTQVATNTTTVTQVIFSTVTSTTTSYETSVIIIPTQTIVTRTAYETVKSIVVTTSNVTYTNSIPDNVTVTSTISTNTTKTATIVLQDPVTGVVLLGILGIVAIFFITWWRKSKTGGF
jgi:hypothetical protein